MDDFGLLVYNGAMNERPVRQESDSQRLSPAGLRSFFRLAAAWKLSPSEQRAALGNIAKHHPESARLNDDQLDRISYLLGIYKALHILFTRAEQADSWIRRPNEATPFGGKPAAALLFSGRMEDLMRVRRFLDGERGAW
jgi:hypothetical protein